MSFADVARSSLRNNKRNKQKMYEAYKDIPSKRVHKTKEKNTHIKNMSKSELKKYRKELQLEAKKRQAKFWLTFLVVFFVLFFYLMFKA